MCVVLGRRCIDAFPGYRAANATRNGFHDISLARLDLLVTFLQRTDIMTVLPAEWKNYVNHHFFHVNFNPSTLHSKYVTWLQGLHKSAIETEVQDASFTPVSTTFFNKVMAHKAFVFPKGGEVCVCPRCHDEGYQTFKEYFPLLFTNLRHIWELILKSYPEYVLQSVNFDLYQYITDHETNLAPIENFMLKGGRIFARFDSYHDSCSIHITFQYLYICLLHLLVRIVLVTPNFSL